MANPSRLAAGTVIEAHLDKKRGPVATLLVQVSASSAVAALNEGAWRSYLFGLQQRSCLACVLYPTPAHLAASKHVSHNHCLVCCVCVCVCASRLTAAGRHAEGWRCRVCWCHTRQGPHPQQRSRQRNQLRRTLHRCAADRAQCGATGRRRVPGVCVLDWWVGVAVCGSMHTKCAGGGCMSVSGPQLDCDAYALWSNVHVVRRAVAQL